MFQLCAHGLIQVIHHFLVAIERKMGTSPHASYQMYNETKVYEGDWYINVDVKHDESHDENH